MCFRLVISRIILGMGQSHLIQRPSRFTSASELALAARREIITMTAAAKASHVGSALSVVDILSVLYTRGANATPANMEDADRDIVILSKGHAASALYSVLSLQGFFPNEWLQRYCENNAPLGGHVTSKGVPGVELSTGSLGHGLPYGLGIAMSRKMSGITGRVFVVMSDGECDEGTTWESAMIANHHNLDNLIVIVDRNRIQSLTSTEETLKLEPFEDKWKAFGWETRVEDGHNYETLLIALNKSSKPVCVIAETTKGKGVDFMENSVLWHYKSPADEDVKNAFSQLKAIE
jgi:transketolase